MRVRCEIDPQLETTVDAEDAEDAEVKSQPKRDWSSVSSVSSVVEEDYERAGANE